MALAPTETKTSNEVLADKLEKIIDSDLYCLDGDTKRIHVQQIEGIGKREVFEILQRKYLAAGWKYFNIYNLSHVLVISKVENPVLKSRYDR